MNYILSLVCLLFFSCGKRYKGPNLSKSNSFTWNVNLSSAKKVKVTDLLQINKVTALEWGEECMLSGGVVKYEIDQSGNFLGVLDNQFNNKFSIFRLADGRYYGSISIDTDVREKFIHQISDFEFVDDEIYFLLLLH